MLVTRCLPATWFLRGGPSTAWSSGLDGWNDRVAALGRALADRRVAQLSAPSSSRRDRAMERWSRVLGPPGDVVRRPRVGPYRGIAIEQLLPEVVSARLPDRDLLDDLGLLWPVLGAVAVDLRGPRPAVARLEHKLAGRERQADQERERPVGIRVSSNLEQGHAR